MPNKTDNKTVAYNAAVEASTRNNVGFFIESIEEDEGVVTYLFESKLKGYVGWRWSVSIFQGEGEGEVEPTVSEVLLVPGPDSLVAPDWVPWSERLADYKALQAELEAQAALDAEEAEDSEDAEDAEDADSDEVAEDESDADEDADEAAAEVEEVADANETTDEEVEADSALANVEEGVEPQADSGKTRKLPRFLRRRNRGSGKKKND